MSARRQPPRIGLASVLEEIIERDEVSGEAWMTALVLPSQSAQPLWLAP